MGIELDKEIEPIFAYPLLLTDSNERLNLFFMKSERRNKGRKFVEGERSEEVEEERSGFADPLDVEQPGL
jgi:hypothetical protein